LNQVQINLAGDDKPLSADDVKFIGQTFAV
jgi:hypothetical protein